MLKDILTDTTSEPDRARWLDWSTIAWWLLLGGYVSFYIPRLETIFASFGADLPLVTRLWLGSRILFMMAFAAASVAAVLLVMSPREYPLGRSWTAFRWGALAGAACASVWSVSALFAPMFMGTLVEAPASRRIGFVYMDLDGQLGAERAIAIGSDGTWTLLESRDQPGLFDVKLGAGKVGPVGELIGLPPDAYRGAGKIWKVGEVKAFVPQQGTGPARGPIASRNTESKMDLVSFLVIFGAFTFLMGDFLRRKGKIFLAHAFEGSPDVADAVSGLLSVGFYMICAGISLWNVAIPGAKNLEGFIAALALRLGLSILAIGVLHFFNILVVAILTRKKS